MKHAGLNTLYLLPSTHFQGKAIKRVYTDEKVTGIHMHDLKLFVIDSLIWVIFPLFSFIGHFLLIR